MEQKVFVLPNNDLEAHASIEMLKTNGYKENENLFITKQQWGASWDGLEPEIKNALEQMKDVQIYGMELQGENPYNAINIDHHVYEGDDRSNPKSSIEQTADILKVNLSQEEKFIAANDKAYIPGMKELGKELNMTETDIDATISKIRMNERAIQGITPEQEQEATKAIKNMEYNKDSDTYTVNLSHSKCATITDRLYGQYNNLLIVCGDGEVDFYGKGAVCKTLQEELGGWSGGDLDNSGFWGKCGVDTNEINKIKSVINKEMSELSKTEEIYPDLDEVEKLTTPEKNQNIKEDLVAEKPSRANIKRHKDNEEIEL